MEIKNIRVLVENGINEDVAKLASEQKLTIEAITKNGIEDECGCRESNKLKAHFTALDLVEDIGEKRYGK